MLFKTDDEDDDDYGDGVGVHVHVHVTSGVVSSYISHIVTRSIVLEDMKRCHPEHICVRRLWLPFGMDFFAVVTHHSHR